MLGQFLRETKTKTDFAATRFILPGKTNEVGSCLYLKGIAIDLIRVHPKVRTGGSLGGDDFARSVWEHKTTFEPTLVVPFAVYFAEAVGATIYALPYSQFCLQKGNGAQFAFVALTGEYDDVSLRNQFTPERLLKITMWERFPRLKRVVRKTRDSLLR